MINKYAEIQDKIILYNACKGMLRTKTARSALENELMQDAFNSGKKLNQIDTTFSSDTRPEMQDYSYTPEGHGFEATPEEEAANAENERKLRQRVLTMASGGLGAGAGLYATRNIHNPYIKALAAISLGSLAAYGGHKLGNTVFGK